MRVRLMMSILMKMVRLFDQRRTKTTKILTTPVPLLPTIVIHPHLQHHQVEDVHL